MVNLHDFLVKNAKFPFPRPDEHGSIISADISPVEVGKLDSEWKANYAVRDEALVQKLCNGLENILGDSLITTRPKTILLMKFSPLLGSVGTGVLQDREWRRNPNEAHSRALLDKGFFEAARIFLAVYGDQNFETFRENSVEGGSSSVDYILVVDDNEVALCEAKSPSVMYHVGQILPEHGIKLTWLPSKSLLRKILSKAALYLGLRRMEWLFLTCHNYWIVCRLVSDNDHPFLAYSPMISIEDSSEPFRAFLGAILSVVKGTHIEPSTFNPDMQLDTIIEETDDGPQPDHSGAYRGSPSKGGATKPPMTRSHAGVAGHDNAEHGLMITSSSPSSPESFQVWIHLHALSNNTLALPVPGTNGQRRLWLTRFIGSGSTGRVWQSHFDNSDDSFAVKIVEVLRPSDADRRQRLRNEFNVYLKIEAAYRSKRLRDRIAPICYGAFEGDVVDVLVLDLCDSTLNIWDELSDSELAQVYKLVQDLHSIGVMHGDVEPRNVMRAPGGGFRLIDFTESRKHICKENMVLPAAGSAICYELETLRKSLWNRRLVQPRPMDLQL